MVSREEAVNLLAQRWLSAGVRAGDTLLVHSSLRRTLRECKDAGFDVDPIDVLTSLQRAVGNEGTLIFPLFNFDFAKSRFFDVRKTPSRMGALTEAARQNEEAVRTGHPMYSFAVVGRQKNVFRGLDNRSGYGEDSPFALLRRLGGKIAAIDVYDSECMTFYHHVEEMMQVSYRYYKDFDGIYVDAEGIAAQKTYRLYVRDLEAGVMTDVAATGEALWEAGLYRGHKPHVDSGMRLIDAESMYAFVRQIIIDGRALGNLYSIGQN